MQQKAYFSRFCFVHVCMYIYLLKHPLFMYVTIFLVKKTTTPIFCRKAAVVQTFNFLCDFMYEAHTISCTENTCSVQNPFYIKKKKIYRVIPHYRNCISLYLIWFSFGKYINFYFSNIINWIISKNSLH